MKFQSFKIGFKKVYIRRFFFGLVYSCLQCTNVNHPDV